MREFNVDLIIDKTFNVLAETPDEAKELAIQKARAILDSYNSLEIDYVYEMFDEDLDFENEYEVMCFNEHGRVIYTYSIEADHTLGAATAAEEFFKADFPDEKLSVVRVLDGDIMFDDYDIVEEE